MNHPAGDGNPSVEELREIFFREREDRPASGRLSEADRIKRDLEERFPGWQVWFVPHLDRSVTWCARRWPLLNEDSPEHLAEAIEQSGKDNVTWLP